MQFYSVVFFLLIAGSLSGQPVTGIRYVDATAGRDDNDGTSPEKAWKTLEKINAQEFGPGATLLFKAGERWTGTLTPRGSGAPGAPIRMDRYGEGDLPLIEGTGSLYALRLFNQSFWEIHHLAFTNFNEVEEGKPLAAWEAENRSIWADAAEPLPAYTARRTRKCAILVEAADLGAVRHLHFKGLEIHGVNGDISSKHNGGIFLEISGDKIPTWFEDLLIEDCYIHDVDRTGVSNRSSWEKRTLTENINWTPSLAVVVRNNRFERTGANALIVRVADHPLIEGNLFDHCAIKESGNANFPFNCDNALIQYNEARFTKYNIGDEDAGGFDSDYNCKNTIIQYNYSHDNEFGGILVCCQGGAKGKLFNDSTQVRFNVFTNNGRHSIRVAGTPTNTLFYRNVITTGTGPGKGEVIWHKSWRGFSDKTFYFENFFYILGDGYLIDLGASTENLFQDNRFFGQPVENAPPTGPLPPDRKHSLLDAFLRPPRE